MKKYLAILLALMLIPASALAADVKISALPEATTMAASDLFVIVDVGTNTTKKITATNFFANIPAPFTFNTGGDSYIQFETNTTYDPSSGYHLYVEGGVFKLYDGSERTILVSGQTLALGANNLTMTGSLAATGARVTKGWFTDVESTNMPTVGGTAILSSLTAPVFTTSIEAPFIVLGSAATAADAGTIRMPNAGSIQFEADAAGTDINALSVDSSEIIQIGSAGASGVTITPATTITGAATLTGGITSIGAAADAADIRYKGRTQKTDDDKKNIQAELKEAYCQLYKHLTTSYWYASTIQDKDRIRGLADSIYEILNEMDSAMLETEAVCTDCRYLIYLKNKNTGLETKIGETPELALTIVIPVEGRYWVGGFAQRTVDGEVVNSPTVWTDNPEVCQNGQTFFLDWVAAPLGPKGFKRQP